jgi:hypothetical protein
MSFIGSPSLREYWAKGTGMFMDKLTWRRKTNWRKTNRKKHWIKLQKSCCFIKIYISMLTCELIITYENG